MRVELREASGEQLLLTERRRRIAVITPSPRRNPQVSRAAPRALDAGLNVAAPESRSMPAPAGCRVAVIGDRPRWTDGKNFSNATFRKP